MIEKNIKKVTENVAMLSRKNKESNVSSTVKCVFSNLEAGSLGCSLKKTRMYCKTFSAKKKIIFFGL